MHHVNYQTKAIRRNRITKVVLLVDEYEIVIETLEESSYICWEPTNNDMDRSEDNSKLFALLDMGFSECVFKDIDQYYLSFATDGIASHFYGLLLQPLYYDFYFRQGGEQDDNGGWEDAIRRDVDNEAFIAANYIVEQGVDNFDLRYVESADYRGMQATSIKTGQCFIFKDVDDYGLYLNLLEIMEEWEEQYQQLNSDDKRKVDVKMKKWGFL